jgi:Transcriptional regulatory protein, C terminal
VQIGTRVLGRAEADTGPDGAGPEPADAGGSLPAVLPRPGGEGTLLAVVPIPGTGTSLAIVGYPVPAPGGPLGAADGDAVGGAVLPAGTLPPGTLAPGTLVPGTFPAGTPIPGQAGNEQPGLLLDHEQRRVWVDGTEIPLTFQEFELLAFLSARPATVFSRSDLVREVWQRDFAADSRTVDVHVSRLRHKLGPAYGKCLVTEYRVGYQFRPQ